MQADIPDDDPLEPLADSFVERIRRGEVPTLEEYIEENPALEERIREIFPTLALVEELAIGDGLSLDGAPASGVTHRPERIGEYRIVREIGRGGMGIVYEAEQESLVRRVALKVLTERLALDGLSLERFRREAQSAARLHHANIVPVFDVGEIDEVHYYAMQLIHGHGLDQILNEIQLVRSAGQTGSKRNALGDEGGKTFRELAESLLTRELVTWHEPRVTPSSPPPPPDRPETTNGISSITQCIPRHYYRSVADIGRQVAESMAFAHEEGVLHRDIKPSNLLLDPSGHIWVTDFGLAKALDVNGENLVAALTRTGDVVGTIRYMAPERFRGWSDPRSDIYSLGITLYEMLTLRPAYEDMDRIVLIDKVTREDPPKPCTVDRLIPRDLETIVLKSIDKEPGMRYQSAAAMAGDLRNFLADRPIQARRAALTERTRQWCRRNPALAGMFTIIGVLLFVIAAGTSLMSWRLSRSLMTSEELRAKAEKAERQRTGQLRQSLLNQAQAALQSPRLGARAESLAALRQAAAIRPGLDLRNEAIAAMALIDIRPTPIWKLPIERKLAVFDPQLKFVLSEDSQRHAVIRDSTGVILRRFPVNELVDGLFSPNGQFLLVKDLPNSGEHDQQRLRVFDWREGKELWAIKGTFLSQVFDFHPTAPEFVLAGRDHRVTFYDVPSFQRLREFPVPNETGLNIHLRYHPSGRHLAFVSAGERYISQMDVNTGKVSQIRFPLPANVLGRIEFSLDGTRMVAGCRNWRAYVWDVLTGELVSALVGHKAEVAKTEFVPHTELVGTSGWDNNIRLWDEFDGHAILALPGLLRRFSSDGRRLAFQDGQTMGVLDITPAREFRFLRGHTGKDPSSLSFSADGRLLISSGSDGIVFWDVPEGKRLGTIPLPEVPTAKLTPDGMALITASSIGLHRWPVRRSPGRLEIGPPHLLIDESAPERRAVILPNGDSVIVASDSANKLDIVSLRGVDRKEIACDPMPNDVDISPDGKWILASSWQKKWMGIFELATKRRVKQVSFSQFPVRAFSPDGQRLLWGTRDGCQVVSTTNWEAMGQLSREITGQSGFSLAFNRDGLLLAVARVDGIVKLLDGNSYVELASLITPFPQIRGELAFSPDGTSLAMCTPGGVAIWDLRLIRSGLEKMELDWDQADLPPRTSVPVKLEVIIHEGTDG